MEWDTCNCDYSEDLCRVYKNLEHSRAMDLDLCELILQSSSPEQNRREWIPASEWTRNFQAGTERDS
jgi:hypothetical protein